MTAGERKEGRWAPLRISPTKVPFPFENLLLGEAGWLRHTSNLSLETCEEIEIQSCGSWVTGNRMNYAFIMHLLGKKSLPQGRSPLLVGFIEASPRWRSDSVWRDRYTWGVGCFHSPALCGVGDVLGRYTILLPSSKLNVCFYEEERERRTKHGGGLCFFFFFFC